MGSDANPEQSTCRRILYTGRVQGVGFRYTTARIARDYAVSGYVRNLPDGTVEIVVSGAPATIDEFLQAVAAAFTGYIGHSRSMDHPSAEPFSRFEIRR